MSGSAPPLNPLARLNPRPVAHHSIIPFPINCQRTPPLGSAQPGSTAFMPLQLDAGWIATLRNASTRETGGFCRRPVRCPLPTIRYTLNPQLPHIRSKLRLALRLGGESPNLRPSPKKLSPYPDAGNQPLTSAKVGFRGKRRFDRPLATHLFPLPFTQTGLQPITPLLRHPISHPFCVLCVLLRPISVPPLCVSASWW